MRIRRRRRARSDASGTMDSLTDTVTNMLGIVIILILIAGARTRARADVSGRDPAEAIAEVLARIAPHVPLAEQPEEIPEPELLALLTRLEEALAADRELAAERSELARLEAEAEARRSRVDARLERATRALEEPFDASRRARLLELLRALEGEVALTPEPDGLDDAELVALLERLQELVRRGEELDRDELALARRHTEAGQRLDAASAAIEEVQRESDVPRRTISVSAPIVQEYADRESHYFYVRDGRVGAYPHQELVDLALVRFRKQLDEQRNHRFSGSVGPVNGWRGRYEGRVTIRGNTISVSEWTLTFVPPRGTWGETYEECARPNGAFQRLLSGLKPEEDLLYFILYTDSFGVAAEGVGVAVSYTHLTLPTIYSV